MTFIALLIANKVTILAFLVALSEVLALIPGVKSNSVFEVVMGVLTKFVPTKETPVA